MLSRPKIFLDMDQVVANFLKSYLELAERLGTVVKPPFTDNSRNPELFRLAVSEHSIFTDLEFMPKADALIAHLRELEAEHDLQIEMLTSVNSQEDHIAKMAAEQKNIWLKKMGITWKPNFVRANHEKALYATYNSILIDDSLHCIEPFFEKGGLTIHYAQFDEAFVAELSEKLTIASGILVLEDA